MHADLAECIATARHVRDAVLVKTMSIKEANAVTAANHTVITAHALDLRERIFLSEIESRTAKAIVAPERAKEAAE